MIQNTSSVCQPFVGNWGEFMRTFNSCSMGEYTSIRSSKRSVADALDKGDCCQAGKHDMWTNENVDRVIYAILGLGSVLLIIDTVFVDLPIDLIVLGICAPVLGGVAIIGVSVRQIINREDVD